MTFSFIAQIIQEIDDFSITFVPDKSTLSADNTVSQEVATSTMKQEDNDADTVDTSKETLVKELIVEDTESKVERGSQAKQVREYMLSMNYFTVKDLKRHFPNLTT